MNALTIEIHGVGAINRGAELMAIAIADRLRLRFPGVGIAVPPRYGSFESRARHRFLSTTDVPGPWTTRTAARLMPTSVRRHAGLVHPDEVDAVLDASGFAFSDKWGATEAVRLREKMCRHARREQPLILLPQAFGPFVKPDVARDVGALLARAELVYARDRASQTYVEQLRPNAAVSVAPDFTIEVTGRVLPDMNLPTTFCAIVPNMRMIDKTSGSEREYLDFLTCAVESSRARGLDPIFVTHDSEDSMIVSQLHARGTCAPLLTHVDPRMLKWVLGQATTVIGSRYHALIGALSQGVPCIAAGWAHKYDALFSEFGCPDYLITDVRDTQRIPALLERLNSPEVATSLRLRLLESTARMRADIDTMWGDIFALLERRCGSKNRRRASA